MRLIQVEEFARIVPDGYSEGKPADLVEALAERGYQSK